MTNAKYLENVDLGLAEGVCANLANAAVADGLDTAIRATLHPATFVAALAIVQLGFAWPFIRIK